MSIVQKGVRSLKQDGVLETSKTFYRLCIRSIFKNHTFFDEYTKARHYIHRALYDAPADPYKVLWIDPERPDCASKAGERWLGLGQIIERNHSKWEFDDIETYKSVKQRFEQNKEWKDTDIYKKAKRMFENGSTFEGYKNIEQFEKERCEYVDRLFESIQREGYKPINSRDFDMPDSDVRANKMKSLHRLEPLVVIDADGSIYYRDGFHRIAIAEVLGINSIPVNVLARHRGWQNIRDDIYKTEHQSELNSEMRKYLDHPDLKDVA